MKRPSSNLFVLLSGAVMGLIGLGGYFFLGSRNIDSLSETQLQIYAAELSPDQKSPSSPIEPSAFPKKPNALVTKTPSINDSGLDWDRFLKSETQRIHSSPHGGRILTVMEISRWEGVERLLNPALDWQGQSPIEPRDILILVAPLHNTSKSRAKITGAIKKSLTTLRSPNTEGQVSVLYSSDLPHERLALDTILRKAAGLNPGPNHGVTHQRLLGPVGHIIWVRTTLSRWDLLPPEGLVLDGESFSPTNISALLVDPSRKMVTPINLLSYLPRLFFSPAA